jgi:hypothetical protein
LTKPPQGWHVGQPCKQKDRHSFQTEPFIRKPKTMFPSESKIEMSIEDLQEFAKQAKMTLEILNETLLGLQSRLNYDGCSVKDTDIVELTFTLTFLIKGALNKGNGIFLY